MKEIREITAKIRNLFSTGAFQKRYGDGRVQVMTHTERVLEKEEAFPYGFTAKAKSGRVIVFCQGGNYNDFEILPILKADDVTPPELEDGDAALYTASGGWVICRENGDVEINGKEKHFVTFEDLDNAISAFLQTLNAHIHLAGGTPPATPMSLNISAAKTEKVKTS